MQTAISINQRIAIENELSIQDATIFAHFWALRPSDPKHYVWHGHRVWFPVTPELIAEAVPIVKYEKKTIQASIKRLVDAGLIERRRIEGVTHYAVTEKGRAW